MVRCLFPDWASVTYSRFAEMVLQHRGFLYGLQSLRVPRLYLDW